MKIISPTSESMIANRASRIEEHAIPFARSSNGIAKRSRAIVCHSMEIVFHKIGIGVCSNGIGAHTIGIVWLSNAIV